MAYIVQLLLLLDGWVGFSEGKDVEGPTSEGSGEPTWRTPELGSPKGSPTGHMWQSLNGLKVNGMKHLFLGYTHHIRTVQM